MEESVQFLLCTANLGSVFEDPSRLLKNWTNEFLSHVKKVRPAFLALHLQEVGGKTYEKSRDYVQEFIKILCESSELQEYNRIRVYLDEDYNSAEHFTALGNLYFARNSIKNIKIWNFLTHEWDSVDGKTIHTGNIETVATKEKAKFPQHFFPECKWSRKGYLRTRWEIERTTIDLINIHLFHDASNLAACESFPSVYCKSRRRALVHTLERFHKDSANLLVPFFIFGDFNFRCDTEGVIKKLTEDLTEHRIQHLKSDNSKVQYRNEEGLNVLTVGKKEFTHADQITFKEDWFRQFDKELEPINDILYEFPITFPPTYPYEEEPHLPQSFMSTRCPAWCDRILLSPTAKKLMDDPQNFEYSIIGENVCMGDHKPVYLNLRIRANQGIKCHCEHDKQIKMIDDNKENNAIINRMPCKISDNHINCFNCLKRMQLDIDRVILDDIDIYNNINNSNNNNNNPPSEATTQLQNPKSFDSNNEQQFCDKLKYSKLHKSPLVSINVVDTDNNLNVCLCAMMHHSSDENLFQMHSEIFEEDKICPICRNIIKQQPNEPRPTLISKKLMLGNDVVVNRIDSHFLSISHSNKRLQEPYTPESCESHSPQPEVSDDKEFPVINETIDSPDILENMEKLKHKKPSLDLIVNFDSSTNVSTNPTNEINLEATQNIHSYQNSHTVSPRQLKSRLEILRRESQIAGNVVAVTDTPNFDNNTGNKHQKINKKSKKCCMDRDCVII